jgi:hypothetical protein
MKREPFDYRWGSLPDSFVRPAADDQQTAARSFSLPGERHGERRKIFVIKQASRLASTNGAGKKIRRILIFDNHPDTLGLVFGRRRRLDVDLSRSQRISSWELIVVSLLTVAGLVGMFWPLL